MFKTLPPAEAVIDEATAAEAVAYLSGREILAADTETTGLNRQTDMAVVIGLSDGVRRFAVYPRAFPYVKKLMEDPELKLVFHNANFDTAMLRNSGIDIYRYTDRAQYRALDTLVMHALIDSAASHGLKPLADEYAGLELVDFSTLFSKEMRKSPLSEILLRPENEGVVTNYSSLDPYATFLLYEKLKSVLEDTPCIRVQVGKSGQFQDVPTLYSSMWDYYNRTEVPFTRVLHSIERNGIKVDPVSYTHLTLPTICSV